MRIHTRLVSVVALGMAAMGCAAQVVHTGTLSSIGPPVPIPLGDVVFVLDRSNSITQTEYDDMLTSIQAAIGASIPETANFRIGVVTFNTAATMDLAFTRANDPGLMDALADILNSTGPGGGTDLSVGLSMASQMMSKSNAMSKHCVVLTDASAGQVNSGITIAQYMRNTLDTRVSVGYLDNECDRLAAYQCITDAPQNAWDILSMARVANAPIDPPMFGPVFGPRLWGVLNCIPHDVSHAAFYDEALCPLSYVGSLDIDGNLIPDACDIFIDCDGNGVDDIFDPDCDGDGIPDACETDCDGDGIPNGCDPTPGNCLFPCPPVPVGGGD